MTFQLIKLYEGPFGTYLTGQWAGAGGGFGEALYVGMSIFNSATGKWEDYTPQRTGAISTALKWKVNISDVHTLITMAAWNKYPAPGATEIDRFNIEIGNIPTEYETPNIGGQTSTLPGEAETSGLQDLVNKITGGSGKSFLIGGGTAIALGAIGLIAVLYFTRR